MLWSFRIRIGNISLSATEWHFPLWKWGKPQPSFPLHDVDLPCNTAVPRPTARTTPNRSSDGWGTVAHRCRKVPHWLQWRASNSLPKVPLPVDRSPNRTTCLIPRRVRPMMSNGIRIRFTFFPQCTGQTDARTDRPTDGQIVLGKVWQL